MSTIQAYVPLLIAAGIALIFGVAGTLGVLGIQEYTREFVAFALGGGLGATAQKAYARKDE